LWRWWKVGTLCLGDGRRYSLPIVDQGYGDGTMHTPMPRRSVTPAESIDTGTAEATPVRRRRVSRKSTVAPTDSTVLAEERVSESNETSSAPPNRSVRRKAPPRPVVAPTESVIVGRVTTAPATVSASRRYPWIIVVGVIVVGIAGSAALGLSDTGTIDVGAKLQQHAAQGVAGTDNSGNETTVAGQYIPVQNTPSDLPNGGLRGRGVDSASTPVVPPASPGSEATSTASSSLLTSEGATSTETVPADTAGTTTPENPGGDGATPM
jgi:hypothetical protein